MNSAIEEAIEFLCATMWQFEDERESFEYDEASGLVKVPFPYERDLEMEVGTFLSFVQECRAMKISQEDGLIKTPNRVIQIITPENSLAEEFVHHRKSIGMFTEDGFELSIQYENFIVGCASLISDAYHRKYYTPFNYIAIEAYSVREIDAVTDRRAEESIAAFVFELADSHNVVFSVDSFVEFIEDSVFISGEIEKNSELEVRPLLPYSRGMELYMSALQVHDNALRLFSLYKVFEYYSPVVLNLEGADALRRKLDSSKVLSPDAEFLHSIFDLVRSVDNRRTDREMMRLVFEKCFDLIDLNDLLPESLRRSVGYAMSATEKSAYSRDIADVLVATRNQVAHAKSNYKPLGIECAAKDMYQFNRFLKAAAAQTIRWHARLPEHQRIAK